MSLFRFVKDLRLIEQITDQFWVSLSFWALLVYIIFKFQTDLILSIVLIFSGMTLSLTALVKKINKKEINKNKTVDLGKINYSKKLNQDEFFKK